MKKYKDSRVNWIGEIPAHWEIIKVKNLALNNGSLFIDGDWIESDVIQETGIRYLTTGNIGAGKFKRQGNNYISEETFHSMNCLKALPGDLAISRLNEPIGRACILPYDEPRYVVAVDIVILRPDSKYDKEYISYCMNTVGYSENASIMSRGTTMKRISRGGLGNFSIPITSYSEQRLISNFLNKKTSEIDTLISDKEKLIALLEEKRQAIITETVTKGLNPDVKMKDSGVEWIGEIPEHWGITKLGRVSDVIDPEPSHRAPAMAKEEGFPYIGIRDINPDGSINLETARRIEEPALIAQENRFTINTKDIIFCRVATIGHPRVLKKETRIALSATLALIQYKPTKINYLYLLYYLNSLPVKIQSELFSTGSTRRSLGMEVLRKFDVILPNYEEQIEIIDHLKKYITNTDIIIETERDLISKLKEYRQALIYEAVTGKIDVQEMLKEIEQEEVSSS
ncbi:type I restriction enzyme, S subunit [Jeotgalicoccus aerolatus]|uniref:Type I restriction enzyme, S subunit n=1 Tax=Jeotgalicoccus aerolatus TaxID=709510 RepID=A0A1G9EES5_9STAP|nr:restriction endonuclease subunit S [Jeotgalicoccus aerolatus]SDK74535.1 type I restriction enzyme, S subunit [Jeotgalicoccus aerolatus]